MAADSGQMNVAEGRVRVCPDCGSPAGSQPFCARCGRNLSMVERLPTRSEWERNAQSSAVLTSSPEPAAVSGGIASDVGLIEEVANALASIPEFWVPLTGLGADLKSPAVSERVTLAVHDRVADALREALPRSPKVEVNDLVALVPLAEGRSIEQRFQARVDRPRGQAGVCRVGSVKLLGADDEVIRSFAGAPIPTSEARSNRSFLISAYILAVVIPVVGILMALYTAVSERRAAIRRHAIAIAGVSILAAGAYVLAITSINSANQDSGVAADLRSLLNSNSIQYDSVDRCAHESGNQYVCMVTRNGQQITVQVTDDGKTIYELGISPNSP